MDVDVDLVTRPHADIRHVGFEFTFRIGRGRQEERRVVDRSPPTQ